MAEGGHGAVVGTLTKPERESTQYEEPAMSPSDLLVGSK